MKTNNAGSQVYTAGEFFCGFSFGSGWNVILYEICLQENKILGTITFVFVFLNLITPSIWEINDKQTVII